MKKEEFVENIKTVLRDGDWKGVISSYDDPPGRNPSKKLRRLSNWYHSLSDEQKEGFPEIVKDVMDSTFFHFFCVLDDVGFIEDGKDRWQYELYAVKNGQRVLINDPDEEELHNIYQSLTYESE